MQTDFQDLTLADVVMRRYPRLTRRIAQGLGGDRAAAIEALVLHRFFGVDDADDPSIPPSLRAIGGPIAAIRAGRATAA